MNPLVIAVDTGNKNIKTPHTEPFNSGLICHGAIPPAVKSDTLLFDGNYYTLTQSRIPYMYNKTTDWSYYVLTLIAIAKEMMAMGYVRPGQKQVKQDVCLAMGLPPTHIHDLASEYDKYFGRDGRRVVFTYNNVDGKACKRRSPRRTGTDSSHRRACSAFAKEKEQQGHCSNSGSCHRWRCGWLCFRTARL